MNQLQLVGQSSPWLILICLLIGAAYAGLLYQKKAPWSRSINWLLAGLRFLVVSIICWLLLLEPLIRQIINSEESPSVVFAIDNSASLLINQDSSQLKKLYSRLDKVRQELEAKDIRTDVMAFGENLPKNIAGLKAKEASTNLSELLKMVQSNYENRNLDKVVLVSDGIHNQGISPNFLNLNFPVYSLGLGDTTARRDLKLNAIRANRLAYLGNDFPIEAEVENIGFEGRLLNVFLKQGEQVIAQKNITFAKGESLKTLTFYAQARRKGIQRYQVEVELQDKEFNPNNNQQEVFIEVIDGKEKILLVAANPHPDIKALRAAISQNQNYRLDVYIPGIGTLKNERYDLVIFHQIPNIYRSGQELLSKFQDRPQLFVLGAQSDLNAFNNVNSTLKVIGRSGRTDEVTPLFNPNFSKFTFSSEQQSKVNQLPPLSSPFGEYALSKGAEVLLRQKVGNVETSRPLIALNESAGQKTGIIAGEGIWQWRLEEYARNESHEAFDELISKVVQYLSTQEDKRRLRVYPVRNEFYDFERVVFEAEVYNKIYERIYGQKINLRLKDEKGKVRDYSFTTAKGNSRFEISGLPKGVYQYQASAKVDGKTEQVSGEFSIRDLQLEALNATANHQLLRQLAQNTKGKFFEGKAIEALAKELIENPKPKLIHSREDVSELINLKWIFFLLMALLSVEWFLRKYRGSY